MKLEFANLHFDGEIRSKWDVLLRIVGDFAVRIRGRAVYQEAEFCLVEFAIALANWLGVATDLGPDFIYTSLESETEGLVRFTRHSPGSWSVSAAHQDQEALDTFTTSELKDTALAYIRELRRHLQPSLDILEYIEDRNAREDLQHKLEQ